MAREGLTNRKLARVLGTTAGVIAAIRSDRLPVPLAWVPTIGGFIGHDKAHLMTRAIADQGHDILVSIAEALLWERDAIAHEWIELLTEFGGGVLPDPNDVPKIVNALREAIGDSMETHQAEAWASEDPGQASRSSPSSASSSAARASFNACKARSATMLSLD